MKFLSTAAFATLAAAVVEAAITLTVTDSTNESLNGMGLSSIHEGAGINYFLLGTNPEELVIKDGVLQASEGNFPMFFNADNNIVQLSVVGNPTTKIVDGKIDLGSQVYACKNINDPYLYSESSYAVTVGELGSECYPISIKVNGLDGSEDSSSAPASSNETTSAPGSTETSTVASTLTETVCTECTASQTQAVNTISSVGAGAKNVAGVAAAGLAAAAMLL